jgi:hypothetical protein
LVDELHGHRSFAHGCGATFTGAGPDIPGGEDARDARLEQIVGPGGVAGEDEAVGIARDGVVEPLRARLRAEEEEEETAEGAEEPKRTFEATSKFKFTSQDHRFLRALKIAIDDEKR